MLYVIRSIHSYFIWNPSTKQLAIF